MNNDNLEPIEENSPERYITEKQNMYLTILKTAYENKEITEKFYNHARLQRCEEMQWEEVFEHFTRLNLELIYQLLHKDYFILLDRIEKGEAYCEANPSDERSRAGLEGLIKKFEAMTPPE